MCGIAGFICKDEYSFSKGNSLETINNMLNSLQHRGPDDQGIFHLGKEKKHNAPNYDYQQNDKSFGLVLGHRRLSIIDLSKNGHQPKHSDDGKVTIAFNGEIYNYIELREELKKDFTFRTDSDTEVLINAYRAWGLSMFERLDGMFAFALWDAEKQKLICARDPMGIKPFYYTQTDDAIIFASEPRAILKALNQTGSVDIPRISEFILFGLSDHDNGSSYREIQQLKGGRWIEVNTSAEIVKEQSFWIPPQNIDYQTGNHEQILLSKIEESVKRQLRSDVTVGSSLSGGIDSGIIVKLAGELLNGKRETYKTITFTSDNFADDESVFAKKISLNAGINSWNEAKITAFETIPEDLIGLVQQIAEPFTSLSILAQNKVMKKANDLGVKVMLDGQGGDEVYLGYPRVAQRIISEYFHQGKFLKAWAEVKGLSANASLSAKNSILGNFYFSNANIAISRNKNRFENLINKELLNAYRKEVIEERFASTGLQQTQIGELTKYILPRLLKYADRNSMAYSIESRVPHLSIPIIDYALQMPFNKRINKGWTKYAVRKAFNGRLPQEILWAKEKRGFDIPQQQWIKAIKPNLIEWIGDFNDPNKMFNKENLISLIKVDRAGEMHVWRVLSTILWMKFLNVKS